MSSFLYDIYKTYDENYNLGPKTLRKIKKPVFKKTKPKHTFLGFPVNIPFGIPAGPLLNSRFIKGAFDFGFAVSTYKTVRLDEFPCHPYPNIIYVDAPKNLNPRKTPRVIALDKPNQNLNITNSFGVPSKKPLIWLKDVKKALKYQKKGQVMILSFMGTVKPNQTQEDFVNDFVKAAELAKNSGAKILEANLSCPNIGNEGLVCYNLEITEKICKEIRKVIGTTPLILKIGYYRGQKDMEKLARIANKYADAIAAINTLQIEVTDEKGNQVLPGKNRLRSGVCGAAIKWAGLEMVKKLNVLKKKNNYKYEIVGVGGVITPKDYLEYKRAGADLVQSATGAMWNPLLAYEISTKIK